MDDDILISAVEARSLRLGPSREQAEERANREARRFLMRRLSESVMYHGVRGETSFDYHFGTSGLPEGSTQHLRRLGYGVRIFDGDLMRVSWADDGCRLQAVEESLREGLRQLEAHMIAGSP